MKGPEILIPLITTVTFSAMVFGIFYVKAKENLAMIQKGMNPKLYSPAPLRSLKIGLVLVGAGLGLLVAAFINLNLKPEAKEAIYFSFIAIGSGLGFILSYFIEDRFSRKTNVDI